MDGILPYVVFWGSAFWVIYPYVGYPSLLALITRRRRPARRLHGALPSVSVIVAAYNEAASIGRKLDTTLSQDYPPDQLEIVVVSDGSTDDTAAIVAACRDPRVRLNLQPVRQGKSAALNVGVTQARGEILVFTDANALFAPGAIRRLAEHFAESHVGLVSGQGLYAEIGNGTPRIVANGYVRLEAFTKSGESVLGFVGGADGAIYALRRSLYRSLAPTHANDLLHAVQTALAGYASRFDGGAYTVEPSSNGAGQELQRHVRMIAQGFAIFAETAPQLVRRRQWKELWILGSHRLLRWTTSLGLLGVLTASLLGRGPFFRAALAAQVLFYALASFGWLTQRAGWRLGLLALPCYFCVVSVAGIFGLIRFLQGRVQAVWGET